MVGDEIFMEVQLIPPVLRVGGAAYVQVQSTGLSGFVTFTIDLGLQQ